MLQDFPAGKRDCTVLYGTVPYCYEWFRFKQSAMQNGTALHSVCRAEPFGPAGAKAPFAPAGANGMHPSASKQKPRRFPGGAAAPIPPVAKILNSYLSFHFSTTFTTCAFTHSGGQAHEGAVRVRGRPSQNARGG